MSIEGPLTILLVGDYPDDARLGSSKVFCKLRDEFQALGHQCDVVWSPEIGGQPANRQIRQVISSSMAARALAARMGRRRYNVVDAASAEGLFLGLFGLIAHGGPAYVCRSNGLEHLNYQRMLDDHTAGLVHKPWTRRVWYPATRLSQVAAAARLADALIVLNEADRAYALDHRWQQPDGAVVVPHGISDRFLAETPARDAPRGAGLLFCGAWDHVKGINYLCGAVNQLHERGERVTLTVLGPGLPAQTVLADFDPQVRPSVTVIDRAPEDRVMDEYRRHDALLWTSTYEGFGLVVIEAMSQRLPVIATPTGCAATLVRDGETGCRVPTRDVDALVAAIMGVTRDPRNADRMAANARDAVAGMTWRSTAEQTLAVYCAAMARRRA